MNKTIGMMKGKKWTQMNEFSVGPISYKLIYLFRALRSSHPTQTQAECANTVKRRKNGKNLHVLINIVCCSSRRFIFLHIFYFRFFWRSCHFSHAKVHLKNELHFCFFSSCLQVIKLIILHSIIMPNDLHLFVCWYRIITRWKIINAFLIDQTNLFTPQWTIWDIRSLELFIQLLYICWLLAVDIITLIWNFIFFFYFSQELKINNFLFLSSLFTDIS